MNDLIGDIIQGTVRHLVTAGGAYLIAHGLMQGSDMNNLLGSVLFLTGLGWSAYQKYSAQQKTAAKVAAATPSTAPQTGVTSG